MRSSLFISLFVLLSIAASTNCTGGFRIRWSEMGTLDPTIGGETAIDYAFSRMRLGLEPKNAIGAYVGAGWVRQRAGEDAMTSDRDAASFVGGVQIKRGFQNLRFGTRYTPALERVPSFEVGYGIELGGD